MNYERALLELIHVARTTESDVDALLALAARLLLELQTARDRRRCPGLYWRATPECQQRLHDINRTKKRRMETGIACTGSGGIFSKGSGQGAPHPATGVSFRVCSVCYQTFLRDKRVGAVDGETS